jgi:hypothetical protein
LYQLGQSAAMEFTGEHALDVTDWGTVAADGPPGAPKRLDDTKVSDILLRVVLKKKKA